MLPNTLAAAAADGGGPCALPCPASTAPPVFAWLLGAELRLAAVAGVAAAGAALSPAPSCTPLSVLRVPQQLLLLLPDDGIGIRLLLIVRLLHSCCTIETVLAKSSCALHASSDLHASTGSHNACQHKSCCHPADANGVQNRVHCSDAAPHQGDWPAG